MCYQVKDSFVAPSNLQLISQGARENIRKSTKRQRSLANSDRHIDSESNLHFTKVPMLTCLFRLYSLLDGRSLPVHLVLLELEYFNANVGIFSRIELEINTEINKFNSRSPTSFPGSSLNSGPGCFQFLMVLFHFAEILLAGLIDFCVGFPTLCQGPRTLFIYLSTREICLSRGFYQ